MQWFFQQQVQLPVPERCCEGTGAVKANQHSAAIWQEETTLIMSLFSHWVAASNQIKPDFACLELLGYWAAVLSACPSLCQVCPFSDTHNKSPGVTSFSSVPALFPSAHSSGDLQWAHEPGSFSLPLFLFFLFYIPLLALSGSLIKYIVSPYKPCLQRLNCTEVAITTTELFAKQEMKEKGTEKTKGEFSRETHPCMCHFIPPRAGWSGRAWRRSSPSRGRRD